MGWANCGTDSRGRPRGYAHAATCDEPGCSKAIDRGLAYACGGMHGADELSCEDYFCGAHLFFHAASRRMLCRACLAAAPEDKDDAP